MADERSEENFLTRWSRRKREPEIAEDVIDVAVATDGLIADVTEPEIEDEEAAANRVAAEAVDVETMTYGDDFTVFLKRGVPALLKQAALRKLWRSNPILANVDGLNDYDTDFRNPEHNVYKSLWQAGRGFLSQEEQASQHASGRLAPAKEPEVEQAEAEDISEDMIEAEAPDCEQGDSQASEEQAVADTAVVQPDEPQQETEVVAPARVSLRSRLAV
jgi:hypothetical protein